jgi:hypothetical protein
LTFRYPSDLSRRQRLSHAGPVPVRAGKSHCS